MFYHSELQLIDTEHSMEASMQFTSHFLDLTLWSWPGRIQHSCHGKCESWHWRVTVRHCSPYAPL